jgi:hypothetical protein
VLLQLLLKLSLLNALGAQIIYTLLYYCIVWNLLNLLPLWPLDGGQLLRLGTGRWLPAALAARITHGVSLVMVVGLAVLAYRSGWIFSLLILLMLGMQNIQALQGRGTEQNAPRTNPLAVELVERASSALQEGSFKEAARFAHQARAQEGLSPTLTERIWEILGVATAELDEPEEALAYLKRARPNERVQKATSHCLAQLGRDQELEAFQKRWSEAAPTAHMERWLSFALAFIGVAIGVVLTTPLWDMLFR